MKKYHLKSVLQPNFCYTKKTHFLFTSAYNFSLILLLWIKNCSQLHFIIFFPTKFETSLSKSQRGRIYFFYLSLSPPSLWKKFRKATPRNLISALDDKDSASELWNLLNKCNNKSVSQVGRHLNTHTTWFTLILNAFDAFTRFKALPSLCWIIFKIEFISW